jgi:hypothetical protein
MQSNNPLLGNSKIEWAVWSPDQTRILLRFTDDETDVDIILYQMLTLETMKVSPIFQELHLNDNLFISVQWLQDSQ